MANIHKHISFILLTETTGAEYLSDRTPLGKAILGSQPSFDDKPQDKESRSGHQASMRAASTYANFGRTREVYLHQARRTDTTAYYIALADWYGAPRVLEINVDEWTGKIGQTIRVKARDNVGVARVSVVIRDGNDTVLESGEAVQSEAGSPWWYYTTKSIIKMTPFPIVEAIAHDLPGNRDYFVIS